MQVGWERVPSGLGGNAKELGGNVSHQSWVGRNVSREANVKINATPMLRYCEADVKVNAKPMSG